MKIGLMGYGKMGKEIEQIAEERGHTIAWRMNTENKDQLTDEELKQAETVIEFTSPHGVMENIERCFRLNLPVVVGSTGWYTEREAVKKRCMDEKQTMIYGSNFSVGVNVFFALNKKLAKMMNRFTEYQPSITEVHHTQKKDAPSGTAITLAEGIIETLDRKSEWVSGKSHSSQELEIISVREDFVPGTHYVAYESDIDKIEIMHSARNRKGFALGAVLAAEWLKGKTGFYEVTEMFNLGE